MNEEQKQLEEEILEHDQNYWVKNDPIISDADYDLLCRRLAQIDPESKVLHQIHGAVVSKGAQVTRDKAMLSLDKVYNVDELRSWALAVSRSVNENFRVSPKFDGLAVEIDGGILATSGDDGLTGEDISDKLVIVDLTLASGRNEYGELVVMKSILPTLRRSGGEAYKNCRAAAVGIINADDTERRNGRVVAFMPHSSTLHTLELGEFETFAWDALCEFVQMADYPADGLVIALVDEVYAESLGETDHHPRHSIALKFKNPSAQTKLLGVEWFCGKHKLTPVAILEPVEISGCTHDRASLHNWAQIQRLNLMIGDTVTVERCGDVILQVTGRDCARGTHLKEIILPMNCPACGALTEAFGVDIRCTNISCGGTATKKLLDALIRIGVEEIGPTIANHLVNFGHDTVPKVFGMDAGSWADVPGFAGPSAAKMHKQFQNLRLKPVEDYRILAAMNLPGLGLSMSKKILAKFNLAEVSKVETDLEHLEGVGPARAASIREGFDAGLYAWAVGNLNLIHTKGLADRPLVCFTGSHETPRPEWIKLAESRGYAFKNAVTKDLTLLVASRVDTTKALKAAKYGVAVKTYEEFEKDL